MRKSIKLITLAALAAAWSSSAQAATYCGGTIAASWVAASGDVLVQGSWRNDHTQICNITTTWNGISPEVCAAWMAKLDAALTLRQTVTIYYNGTFDCATMPTYGSSPAPWYVMLN